MDDRTGSVQESSDMSISSDDDCIEQQKKSNVELEEDHGEAQTDVLLEDPELGMTFDTENDVREYYKIYAKAKGFGVTRRSSNRDDNGELKYHFINCLSQGSFNLGISIGDMNTTMPAAVPYGAIQESFDFGVSNINPTMTAALPPGGSSAVVMPPILGKYASLLFQVQQTSAALSSSPQLHFNGVGEPNDSMDQS